MFRTLFFLFAVSALFACTPSNDSDNAEMAAVKDVLEAQRIAWNKGDLEGYMAGYWMSDELSFVGKRGMNKGWRQTLENYQKSYSSAQEMGKLTFDVLQVDVISPDYAYVIGRWHLDRVDLENLEGSFTLLLKKIEGEWKIISDHSS